MRILLGRILCSAAYTMWKRDPTVGKYTSDTNQHELNLAFHYACELRRWLPWFDCDFDVSKVACDKERPDIVIHRRETHALNFLVIEIKREKSRKLVAADLKQIRDRWFGRPYYYRFGASVILEDNKPEFEVRVLSLSKKREKPVVLKDSDMGAPLRRPAPVKNRKSFLETIDRNLIAKQRDGLLERETDKLVYGFYG